MDGGGAIGGRRFHHSTQRRGRQLSNTHKHKKKQSSKTERQACLLLSIALAAAFSSIGFGLFHLKFHHRKPLSSSVSFDTPFSDLKSKDTGKLPAKIRNAKDTKTYSRSSALPSIPHKRNHGKSEKDEITASKIYVKYDAAGPKSIPGTARSHALPNAVPFANSIPLELAENRSYHISQRTNTSLPLSMDSKGPDARYNWNHTYHDDFRTLYLYNPSILPLHNTQPRNNNTNDNATTYYDDPDALSDADLLALTGGDSSIRYVATYRAYLGCNCFGSDKKDRELMRAGEQITYLAIALLNSTLDVVEGTDVLIDLNAGPGRGAYGRQFIEDCRINLIKGGIYLLCNEEMKRVKITRTQEPLSSSLYQPYQRPKQKMPYVYPNVHGDGLTITLLSHKVKVGGGKNFNIFRSTQQEFKSKQQQNTTVEMVKVEKEVYSESQTLQKYYLQIWPHPHKYTQLYVPDGRDFKGNEIGNVLRDPETKEKFPEEIAPQLGGLPHSTFDTPDSKHTISKCTVPKQMNCSEPIEVPFFNDEADHGTACCVKVTLPQGKKTDPGREVMVGITHQKLSPRSNFWLLDVKRRYENFGIDRFVSRFVAYETQHPFNIVARSGWFCLGFATDPIELNHPQRSTLAGQNTQFRLDLFDDVYECPVIHFASGFSEFVGNSSRAIIGYGVNDCHPRMFVVEKDEIVRMLTPVG